MIKLFMGILLNSKCIVSKYFNEIYRVESLIFNHIIRRTF